MYDKYGIAGKYEVDDKLTNDNHVTFVNKETGKATIAFRGTEVTNVADLFTDVGIAFGLESYTPRFQEAKDVTEKALKKYGGKDNVSATGHSLGGSQAMYVSDRFGIQSHSYNPGQGAPPWVTGMMNPLVGIAAAYGQQHDKETAKNTHVYQTGIDPISALTFVNDPKADVEYQLPEYVNQKGYGKKLFTNPLETGALSIGTAHGLDNFLQEPPPPPRPPQTETTVLGDKVTTGGAPPVLPTQDPTDPNPHPLRPSGYFANPNTSAKEIRGAFGDFLPYNNITGYTPARSAPSLRDRPFKPGLGPPDDPENPNSTFPVNYRNSIIRNPVASGDTAYNPLQSINHAILTRGHLDAAIQPHTRSEWLRGDGIGMSRTGGQARTPPDARGLTRDGAVVDPRFTGGRGTGAGGLPLAINTDRRDRDDTGGDTRVPETTSPGLATDDEGTPDEEEEGDGGTATGQQQQPVATGDDGLGESPELGEAPTLG